MKKNQIMGIIITLVIVAIGAYYFWPKQDDLGLSDEPIVDNRVQITDQKDAKYQSTVLVNSTEIEDSYGSGYVVNENTIVTNRHVVMTVNGDYSLVKVRAGHKDKNGNVEFIDFKIKEIILPKAEEIDVAVLKLEKREDGKLITNYRKPVEFGDVSKIKKGTVVTVVGYPGDKEYGTLWDSTGPVDMMMDSMFAFKAITQGGNSGSPMFDSEGKIIAMNNAGGENNSFGFILEDKIINFIKDNSK